MVYGCVSRAERMNLISDLYNTKQMSKAFGINVLLEAGGRDGNLVPTIYVVFRFGENT